MTGIHDSVETYEPKVNMGYENSIPKVDSSFDDITDEHGNINIIINSDVIGQTLAKKIYTSWTSGLRELYNNEARACRMAKSMGSNPSLIITINPNNSSRQVSIQGVDSLGITKAMFNKVLRVIGTSGNVDGNEIGQFGMGFISYALMTDALILETWSKETNEHYAMLCDSGLKFKPIPIDKDNGINNMSEHGTKLTMTCNSDVNFSEMVWNIKKLARFSQIPTKIILLDNIEGSDSYYGRRNNAHLSYDQGIIDCESFSNGMEYLKNHEDYSFRNTSMDNSDKVVFYDEITIDNEDYRFDGIMAIRKNRYGGIRISNNVTSAQCTLVGTDIDNRVNVSGFHSAIINIKNERKYSPVASRDSLDSGCVLDLESQLKNDITEYMSKYNISTIDDYNKSLHKCVLARDSMYALDDYLSKDSRDISRTLNTRYSTPDKSTSSLSDMLAVGGTLVCLKSLRQNLMSALDDHFDGTVTFFRLPKKLSDERVGHIISLFKQLNVVMGEDYKKTNKIKENRSTIINRTTGKKESFTKNRSIKLYNSKRGLIDSHLFGSASGWRSGANEFSTTIEDVNENVHDSMVTVDTKRFASAQSWLNNTDCGLKIMHNMKGLSDKIQTLDQVLEYVHNHEYQTNEGLVKGKDLVNEYNVVIMPDIHLLYEIDVKTNYLAVESSDEYIKILWYKSFKNNNVGIVNDLNGRGFGNVLHDKNISFNNIDYDDDKGNHIARMYWIEQLLPLNQSEIFIDAILYDSNRIDSIEAMAIQLSEGLKV